MVIKMNLSSLTAAALAAALVAAASVLAFAGDGAGPANLSLSKVPTSNHGEP
jgi:hypothetical protein